MKAENGRFRFHRLCFLSFLSLRQQLFHFCLIKAGELLFSFDDHRTLEQVRVFQHELDGIFFGRRLLPHILFPVQGCASIQKFLDRLITDDLAQLFICQRVLAVLSFVQVNFFCLQETSCFAARGSGRLVNESNFVRHGKSVII